MNEFEATIRELHQKLADTQAQLAQSKAREVSLGRALEREKLHRQKNELTLRAEIVDLQHANTGEAYDRAALKGHLEREIARSLRYDRRFSLLMLGPDRFSEFVRVASGKAGDILMHELAFRIRSMNRRERVLLRPRRDALAILVPETEYAQVVELADDLRRAISNQAFLVGNDRLLFTLSVGAATLSRESPSAQTLWGLTEARFLQARTSGNRVVAASFRDDEIEFDLAPHHALRDA